MNILLVEDDPVFARVLSRALAARGHGVTVAGDPAAALAAAEKSAPEAAVVDLRLGEASGLALIEPLRARAPRARLLILTGYASIATAVEAIKRGADNYLAKPANAEQVLAALADQAPPDSPPAPPSLRRLEWEHIQQALHAHDGNVSAAARSLGMHRRTLQRKLAKRPVQR